MITSDHWLSKIDFSATSSPVDGIVPVKNYDRGSMTPDEVAVMERAAHYKATAVFFEAGRNGRPPVAQAFVYVSEGPDQDIEFARIHKSLWSWGGVPLVYRVTRGLAQLFRCAHKAEFEVKGKPVFNPCKTLRFAVDIASDPWWNAERLRNGTLWDDPEVCKYLVSGRWAAHKTLGKEVERLYGQLNTEEILTYSVRRKLLILSLLIAYLEARNVFEVNFFSSFVPGAGRYFEILSNGKALVQLLEHLEERFNGHVFTLSAEEKSTILNSDQLFRFAKLIEGTEEATGQRTLWERYSFADLPVELISDIYQQFVKDDSSAVYTPLPMVRLMLGEVLSWDRLDSLHEKDEVILDPSCGSGVFLVESYRRLVLHWRSKHQWEKPSEKTLKDLLARVHGVDRHEGAVELSAFSLCLALCDALQPEDIRKSVRLFPELKEITVITSCFFEACAQGRISAKVGIIVGNPPFDSSLDTEGARQAYREYAKQHGTIPDLQIAYLFLHEAMKLLQPGGILALLQQYNFLYNQQTLSFRMAFFKRWDVREILDFISVRGLFLRGGADTKVVVVVAEASSPPEDRRVLHATFRRSGRTDAKQAFDIDYYDLHWLPRSLILVNDGVWRSSLVGGGRTLNFVDRLKAFPTIGQHVTDQGWVSGQGYSIGTKGKEKSGDFLWGMRTLDEEMLGPDGIGHQEFTHIEPKPIERARSLALFSSPLLLVRLQMDLNHDLWLDGPLGFQLEVFGIAAPREQVSELQALSNWISDTKQTLRAFIACTSPRLFVQKATSCSGEDIRSLPYPIGKDLMLSDHERILVSDITRYYGDFIRLGEESEAMSLAAGSSLEEFNDVYLRQINAIYESKPLRALAPQVWPGAICQVFAFGDAEVNWSGADELRERLDSLLRDQSSCLTITRIARIYDGACIYLVKPDRVRYWLRSVALRDADDTLADLWDQGF